MGPLAVVAAFYMVTAHGGSDHAHRGGGHSHGADRHQYSQLNLGMSPYALMMTVAMSASASFMSPVAHPANVLIMGPGGYQVRRLHQGGSAADASSV